MGVRKNDLDPVRHGTGLQSENDPEYHNSWTGPETANDATLPHYANFPGAAPPDYLELLGPKPHHASEIKLPRGARPVPYTVRRVPADEMLD